MSRAYWGFFRQIRPFLRENPKFSAIIVAVMTMKFLLALITPMSHDFYYTVRLAAGDIPAIIGTGFYAPIYLTMKGLLELWFLLPVDHPNPSGDWFYSLTPGSVTLTGIFKAPLLLFDILTAWMLYRTAHGVFGSSDAGKRCVLLWLLNPLTTLTIEMFGAWDAVASFFVLLSVYYFVLDRYVKSSLALSIGAVAKFFPLFLFPVPLALLGRHGRRVQASYLAPVIAIFGSLVAALVAVGSAAYVGGIEKYLRLRGVARFLGAAVPLYAVGFLSLQIALAVFLVLWLARRSEQDGKQQIVYGNIAYLSIFFALTFWNPQYLLWILPLLALYHGSTTRDDLVYWLTTILAIIWSLIAFGFYFSTWGSSFLFIPADNAMLKDGSLFLNSLFDAYKSNGLVTLFANIIRSMITGLFAFYAYLTLKLLSTAAKRPS